VPLFGIVIADSVFICVIIVVVVVGGGGGGDCHYSYRYTCIAFIHIIYTAFIHIIYRMSHSLPNPVGWRTTAPCRNN
jgi:hypothetical protein